MEHELIASRLDALVRGSPTRIWSTEAEDFVEVEPEEPILPEDVMILVHSEEAYTRLDSTTPISWLPVMADKQGELLKQPVVQPLMAALELLARPVQDMQPIPLRSSIVGASSVEIEEIFQTDAVDNYWNFFAEF